MRDSPIEYTGEAHLVTVSCDLCDETYSVSESTAHHNDENGVPFVCSDCSERLSNLHSDMYITNEIERMRLMADLLEAIHKYE
jgi:transcription initiation factor IIE alpha subunit